MAAPSKWHNPALDILEPMIQAFLRPETERLYALVVSLVKQNHALGGHEKGFYYAGQRYSGTTTRFLKGDTLYPSHGSLESKVIGYRNRKAKFDTDTTRLRLSLSVVLSRCQTVQGMRDALPEPLAMLMPAMRQLPRIQDEGWVLAEFPLLQEQFQKTVDVALYYQANNLIF